MKKIVQVIFVFTLLIVFGLPSAAQESWPQWRGENLDSVSSATDLPTEFDKNKNMKWRFELPGSGGASPIVWEDQIFVISIDDANKIWLICVGTDGKEKWRKQLEGKNQNSRDKANSASPSPITDGEMVWATSTTGFLECFDMDGNRKWSVDLQDRYGRFVIQFGMTSTPVLYQDRLYLQLIHGSMRSDETSKGYVVALDAKTGEEIWMQERLTDGIRENKHSYASPVICRTEGHECLVTHGGDYVIGHSLEDGKEVWRCGGLNPRDDRYNQFLRFVSSPLFVDDKIMVPSAKGGPVFCLNAEEDLDGDITENENVFDWKLERGTPDVSTPVCHDGLVFLSTERGILTVVDAESGEVTFSERMFAGNHRATPVIADGKVYIADRRGTILVVSAEAEPKKLAQNKLGEETTASPAISDGTIYIRTFNALYAFANE